MSRNLLSSISREGCWTTETLFLGTLSALRSAERRVIPCEFRRNFGPALPPGCLWGGLAPLLSFENRKTPHLFSCRFALREISDFHRFALRKFSVFLSSSPVTRCMCLRAFHAPANLNHTGVRQMRVSARERGSVCCCCC